MNRQTFAFTKATLHNLEVKSIRYSVSDTEVPHLRLMVYPTGIKTYVVCRKVKGKPQRIKVGRLSDLTIEQARKQAIRINSMITLGGNPHGDKRSAQMEATLKELFDYYYQEYLLHFTKRPDDNKATFEFQIAPVLGNLKASEITPDKIRKFHAKVAESCAPSTANRVIAIISAVFNFSIKSNYYSGINPCANVRRYRTTSRDRFLNKTELEKFFNAIKQEDELFEHFFLMLLYTGARKSNVLAMKWADIDLDLKRWRVSEQESKNSEVNIIHLCEPAIEILKLRLENKQDDEAMYVFPGNGRRGYLNDPKKAFQRVKNRMEIKNFRMHDLRRTLGSYMAISGISLPIIGKALNHKSQISTAIYARLSDEPVLDAINSSITLIQGQNIFALYKSNALLINPINNAIKFSSLIT